MSATTSVSELAAALAVVAPALVTARVVGRRRLPAWDGAPRLLAGITVAITALMLSAHVAGALGWLRPLPIASVGVAIALGACALPARERGSDELPAPPHAGRGPVLVMLLAIAVVCGQWATRVVAAYQQGIGDYDSLHYHLPHAARFVQAERLTDLHFVSGGGVPNMFHPSDAEVLHALGMMTFGNDVLAPLLNVGWAAVALLAAWCIGRPHGLGPASVVGCLVVLAMPFAALSAGSALNDVPSLAWLLAAIAFLVLQEPPEATVLAGLAAGLALSTKLTVLVPIGVVAVGVVVLAARRRAPGPALFWLGGLGATGSFWFLRNLAAAGSPLPSLRLPMLPSASFPDVDRYGYRVVDYLGSPSVIRSWLLPGLSSGLSPAWPLVAIAVGVAVVVLASRGQEPVLRLLGLCIVVTVVAYAATPTTAMGQPDEPLFFALNLRYAFPAIVVALVLLPGAIDRRWSRARTAVLALFVALLAGSLLGGTTDLPGTDSAVPAWDRGHTRAGLAVFALTSAVGLAGWVRRWRPTVAWVAVGATVLVAALAAPPVQERYLDRRYRADPVAERLSAAAPARVAITGFDLQYPLYGEDLSNHVQYIGRVTPNGGFEDVRTCADWRRRIVEGGYTHLVLNELGRDRSYLSWTRSWSDARPELEAPDGLRLFRLRAGARSGPCS